jgi:glycosyltransferase involved in cell wall biosynthesis
LLAHLDLEQLEQGGTGRLAALARDLWWYPAGLPRRARSAGLDVLHCPSFRAPFRSGVPLVVTVHDLAVLRHPGTFNRWTRTYRRVAGPRVARTAKRIVAVSEFTRRELVELLRVPEERIRVIPNGVGEPFGPDGPAANGEFVLAVGTLEPRKNLARLAEASRRAGLELWVVGARGWGDVRLNGDAGVRWLGELSDERLAELYRGAVCLAYPSLYEGFGIPVLEGMACGTPVVTSAGGATEELAAGAAVLVDPLSPASIESGILEAAGRRDDLARRGLERARLFSWAETAAATWKVYEEIA